MHVTDSPVRVVRQRIDSLDRHHRTFEGRHAIERQGSDQELQDRIVTQLVPGTRQGHDAVDHATPGGSQQDQGEDHTDRLRPIRQCGVVQVVRTRPHVGEDQRPEVDHGQAIGINRTTSLLRHKVVHHAQKARGQEEAHGIVTVPPLNHSILNTRVH